MLSVEELLELEEALREELNDRLEEILARLNRTDQLMQLLHLLGLKDLLRIPVEADGMLEGKILVIGKSEVKKDKLAAVAKTMGLNKDRFEFYLSYEDAKSFEFRKMQWSSTYSAILVGQMPHSGSAKGDYSSIITALESTEGYPPVFRMGGKGLKITKSSFKNTLQELLQTERIA